jgi:hypothetical protein
VVSLDHAPAGVGGEVVQEVDGGHCCSLVVHRWHRAVT